MALRATRHASDVPLVRERAYIGWMHAIWRTVTLAFVLMGCADQSQPGVLGGSGGSSPPSGGTGGAGVGAPESDRGGAAGTVSTAARIYLGDDDRHGDAPLVPLPVTASFYWGTGSNGTYGGWHLGNWFVTADRLLDAPSRQLDPPRDGGVWARGVSGRGRPEGVVLWVQLDHPYNRAVDVRGCSTVHFWARLDSSSGQLTVGLNDGARPSGTFDGRPLLVSRELSVGGEWKEFTLPFESFPFGGSTLTSIEFLVGQGGEPFDLWIDDLALVCRSST